ncbi:MAG: FAD-dependent oxidoreductase [Kiloniellales bacterium]|nr:FAD-dependent oxidoreductase [Kiloniellales bacterium]
MSRKGQHVLVVGAGILGAAIAYHLARRGAKVTVVDRGPPAGEATGASFAWINASFRNPKPYYDLRMLGLQEYRRLEAELAGRLVVTWGGGLNWDLEEDEIDPLVRQHASWGYDLRVVGRDEIRALEPKLRAPPERAVFSACEGALNPVAATEALLAGAEAFGAEIKIGCEVSEFRASDGRVAGLRTAAGNLEADQVVLAAGVASAGLAARLGFDLPLRSSPGLLVHSRPMPPLLGRVVESPGLHMKQDPDGRLVAGESFGGGPAPNDPEAEGQRLIDRIKAALTGSERLEMEHVSVGLRPIPADGLPAIGPLPGIEGLYLAVMHSGITLAPAVGRFTAMELLDGAEVELLAPFRPDRFATG